jgi:acyl-coenzyme A synthetase/AMP-(fatty) acid ligase
MQGKSLGMAVGIFDDDGKDISETGVPGELVCTRPHPSIPVCFWGDDARGSKFLKAYYDTYPGIWRHGDFIAMNPRTKGYIILGRRCAGTPSMIACAEAEVSQRRRVEPIGRALWFGRDLRRA